MSILVRSITVAVYLVLADESSESDNDGTSALPRCRHVGPSRNKSDLYLYVASWGFQGINLLLMNHCTVHTDNFLSSTLQYVFVTGEKQIKKDALSVHRIELQETYILPQSLHIVKKNYFEFVLSQIF